MQQIEEERNEMRNDFLIKFNSFSTEISQLKGKLSVYEDDDDGPEIIRTTAITPIRLSE